MYFVYILKCRDDSLYTWITTDLERRLKQHNWEKKWWAKYTLSRKPVQLVYFEKLENRSLASKREVEIKNLSKMQKINFINENKNMENILLKKLEKYGLEDAIIFEENDRQFLALKNLWEKIEKKSWDLQDKIFFYLGLILGNSLVCYQLSWKWEDYWEEFFYYFSDKFEKNMNYFEIIKLLSEFLMVSKKNRRFTDMKLKRLEKFANFLKNFFGKEKYYYENMDIFREELAEIMNQKKDAKTIVFAIKMFSYGARNIFWFRKIPEDFLIPIDSRLMSLFLKYWRHNEKIDDFYKEIANNLKIPMMHLDAIIWTSYDELIK